MGWLLKKHTYPVVFLLRYYLRKCHWCAVTAGYTVFQQPYPLSAHRKILLLTVWWHNPIVLQNIRVYDSSDANIRGANNVLDSFLPALSWGYVASRSRARGASRLIAALIWADWGQIAGLNSPPQSSSGLHGYMQRNWNECCDYSADQTKKDLLLIHLSNCLRDYLYVIKSYIYLLICTVFTHWTEHIVGLIVS